MKTKQKIRETELTSREEIQEAKRTEKIKAKERELPERSDMAKKIDLQERLETDKLNQMRELAIEDSAGEEPIYKEMKAQVERDMELTVREQAKRDMGIKIKEEKHAKKTTDTEYKGKNRDRDLANEKDKENLKIKEVTPLKERKRKDRELRAQKSNIFSLEREEKLKHTKKIVAKGENSQRKMKQENTIEKVKIVRKVKLFA